VDERSDDREEGRKAGRESSRKMEEQRAAANHLCQTPKFGGVVMYLQREDSDERWSWM
jgi:hypothetical protein